MRRRGPSAYQLVFFVTFPLVMGEGLQRWYLGLEWFQIVPFFSFACVALSGIALAFVSLLGWLLVAYLRHKMREVGLE
jgi:hypothetical protein